jgi:hypothetical protein
MGRVSTPRYRIELSCNHFLNKRKEVHSYAFTGKPSIEGAKKFRDAMNDSVFNVNKAATNIHLSKVQSPYGRATIINQKTGEIVAEYNPPMFEVID